MSSVLLADLQQLVSAHGYWVVALIVGLESMGLPLPGETILVLAAIYAATEPSFNVGVVIAVAAFGAIVGDNAGQSHTFQPHDERHHPIAMRAHKLL